MVGICHRIVNPWRNSVTPQQFYSILHNAPCLTSCSGWRWYILKSPAIVYLTHHANPFLLPHRQNESHHYRNITLFLASFLSSAVRALLAGECGEPSNPPTLPTRLHWVGGCDLMDKPPCFDTHPRTWPTISGACSTIPMTLKSPCSSPVQEAGNHRFDHISREAGNSIAAVAY